MVGRIARLLAVTVMLAGMLTAPAGAAPAPKSDSAVVLEQARQAFPGAAIGGRPASLRAPADLLGGVRDFRDRHAWLSAAAAVIEQRTDADVLVASEEEYEECCTVRGSVAWAHAIDDLDGDGLTDVLATHYSYETDGYLLEARSGTTGATLWHVPSASHGALLWSVGDLTGDGAAEVVTATLDQLTETQSDPCDSAGCSGERHEATFQWLVGVRSGVDGSRLWQKRYDGRLTTTRTTTTNDTATVLYDTEKRYELEGEDVFIVPFAYEPGDGSTALVINAISLALQDESTESGISTPVAGQGTSEREADLETFTHVDLVDARTGEDLGLVGRGGAGLWPLLSPVAQPDGDDLVWEHARLSGSVRESCEHRRLVNSDEQECSNATPEADTEFQMLDGLTLDPLWSRQVEDSRTILQLDGDLDADGRQDVAVVTWDHMMMGSELLLLAGATGETLWGAEGDPLLVGELDAVPGDDLVTVHTFWSGGRDSQETLVLERRNGLRGDVIDARAWQSTSETTETTSRRTYPYVAAGGDADGDGVGDLTTGSIVITDSYEPHWASSYGGQDMTVESARDATVLYRAPEGDLIRPAGDLDGDGVADVMLWRQHTAGGPPPVFRETATAVSLGYGEALWSHADTAWFGDATLHADLDGDGGADILRHTSNRDSHHFQTVVTAVNGRSGTPGWSFTSRP